MLQGLYAAASGMEAQQNQFNAISNDLANINTPGYQSSEVGVEELPDNGRPATEPDILAMRGLPALLEHAAEHDVIDRRPARIGLLDRASVERRPHVPL